jgi:polysaccharide deacetylase 2 family uncharacterized protein YibQ
MPARRLPAIRLSRLSLNTMRLRVTIISLFVLLSVGGGWLLFANGTRIKPFASLRFLLDKMAYASHSADSSVLIRNIRSRLKELEVPDSAITVRVRGPDSIAEIQSPVPQGRPIEWIVWHLSEAAKRTSWRLSDAVRTPDGSRCTLQFRSSSPVGKTVMIVLHRSSRFVAGSAKMAIVIPDFNFTTDRVTIDILAFPHPLTLGILPSRALAPQTARISKEYRKEVVILLPMEGAAASRIDRSVPRIMIHHPEDRIRSMIGDAAAIAPSFAGFSNLGGARVLMDSRATGIIFSEIKKRGGYFIEHPAISKSLVIREASRYGVPTAKIDFIIDTSLSRDALREAFYRFAGEARKRGACIVSCEPSAKTLSAIAAARPGLSQGGVTLSFVSELFIRNEENLKNNSVRTGRFLTFP